MPTKPKPASEEDVRALAHKFWEDEGRPDGMAESHWQRAYEALAKPMTKPAAKKPVATKTSKKKPA